MKPIFYDRCSHKIICNICGFETKSAVDMIKHLGMLYDNDVDNCVKKIVRFEKIE